VNELINSQYFRDGGDESNYRIKRILQRGSTTSSSWLINGKSSSQKQVSVPVTHYHYMSHTTITCHTLPIHVTHYPYMSQTTHTCHTLPIHVTHYPHMSICSLRWKSSSRLSIFRFPISASFCRKTGLL